MSLSSPNKVLFASGIPCKSAMRATPILSANGLDMFKTNVKIAKFLLGVLLAGPKLVGAAIHIRV